MKPTESVKILALAFAAYPGMSIPEGTPEVWHELLKDVDFATARAAVLEHARNSSAIVTPADIRRISRAITERTRPRVPAIDPAQIRQTVPPPEWYELRKRFRSRPRPGGSFSEAMSAMAERLEQTATAPEPAPEVTS